MPAVEAEVMPKVDAPAQRSAAPMVVHESGAQLAPLARGYERALDPTDTKSAQIVASNLAKSQLFGIKDEFDAFARIMAGREMGMSAVTSLRNLFSFDSKQGRSMGEYAESQEARVLQHPDLETWDWLERTDKGAKLLVKRRGRKEQIVEFNEHDAKRAGLLEKDNWTNHPRRMYIARVRGEACALMFSDVTRGLRTIEDLRDLPPPPASMLQPGAAPPPSAELAAMNDRAELLKQMIDSVTDAEGKKKARAAIVEAKREGLSGFLYEDVSAHYDAMSKRIAEAAKAPPATTATGQATLGVDQQKA